MFGFLFWLFFIGIIVASLQDLKRREVDNWLNLFLLISGFIFIFYKAISENDVSIIFHFGFILVIMFIVANSFYYGRIFAGGDYKLLIAMTAFLIGVNFYSSLINIGVFALFLMFSGSIYGLIYSFVLYFKNFKKVNREMRGGVSCWMVYITVLGVILMLLGFSDFLFFIFGILVFLLPSLYIFAKGLENVCMIRIVSGKLLREGDWLVEDIRVGKKIIKADWDGLSLGDIKLLKSKKKIKIKDGLPFVPAFLIAFLAYVFLKNWFLGLFGFLV